MIYIYIYIYISFLNAEIFKNNNFLEEKYFFEGKLRIYMGYP
jgi:hypothetical protein